MVRKCITWLVFGIPCKFVLAQDKNLPANLCNNLAFVFWPAVLQHMLDYVVAILILQEVTKRHQT